MKNVFIVSGNRGTFTTVPVTRLLGAILLAIVIDATMVATIPVMTIQQTAKAYTYCSRTFLAQDERYKCGYNHGYLDAQRDWNSRRWTPSSGGDSSCPPIWAFGFIL
ncbi:MAG: hypothetical protein WBF33_06900 [Candidatus Nitrosopolaris sp.]